MAGGGGGGGDDGEGQDFDLNLAPIIDCFTVLITYMLVSASFISLDMIEVQVAASSPPSENSPPPPPPDEIPMSVSAQVTMAGMVLFHVTGKEEAKFETTIDRIPAQAEEIQSRWPTLKEINVKAEPGVQYKSIVKTVETLKKPFAKVYLGE